MSRFPPPPPPSNQPPHSSTCLLSDYSFSHSVRLRFQESYLLRFHAAIKPPRLLVVYTSLRKQFIWLSVFRSEVYLEAFSGLSWSSSSYSRRVQRGARTSKLFSDSTFAEHIRPRRIKREFIISRSSWTSPPLPLPLSRLSVVPL